MNEFDELKAQLIGRLDVHAELVRRVERALLASPELEGLPAEAAARMAEAAARHAGAVVSSIEGPAGPGAGPAGGPFMPPGAGSD